MNGLRKYLPALVRTILGAIFIYAALLKIADPVAFAGSVAAYRILPYFASYLTAAVLPFVELTCGLLLVCGYRVKVGALIIAVMNLVFMVALASAIARGLDIDCGCFKQGGAKTSPWIALARDVVFLAMSLFVLKSDGKGKSRIAPMQEELTPID
jgi:putative oxidoreductase